MKGNPWKLRVLLSCALLLGCGPKGQAEPQTPEEQAEGSAQTEKELPPPEPAAAPAGVFLRARVKSPQSLSEALADAAASPVTVEQLLDRVAPQIKQWLGTTLDPKGSVDALVSLNPVVGRRPFTAWSFASFGVRPVLASLDQAQIEFDEGPSGVYYFAFEHYPCAVGRSRGTSPARIVCADRAEALEALVDYMLRGFPDEQLTESAVHAELITEPLQAAYGSRLRQLQVLSPVLAAQLHQGEERFDQALTDAVTALARELIALAEDAVRVDLDVWVKDRTFETNLAFTQRGKNSWVADAATELSRVQGVAPALFRALPASVSSASYYRALPKQKTTEIAETTGILLEGALVNRGLPESRAAALSKPLLEMLFSGHDGVIASGPTLLSGEDEDRKARAAFRIWGTTRPLDELEKNLESLAQGLSSRDMRNLMKESDAELSLLRQRKGMKGVVGSSVYEWKLSKSLARVLALSAVELPAGNVGDAFGGGEGLLTLMSHAGFTWMVIGETSTDVQQGIDALRSEGGELVGAQPQYDKAKETPAVYAGFSRVGALLGWMSPILSPSEAQLLVEGIANTPHQGRVPMTHFVQTRVAGTVVTTFSLWTPPEFLTDLFGLILLSNASR